MRKRYWGGGGEERCWEGGWREVARGGEGRGGLGRYGGGGMCMHVMASTEFCNNNICTGC